jgi:predicted glutamine amidotransferase
MAGEKMCELFGACFASTVNPYPYLDLFFKRSELHPHGWGIAYYPSASRKAVIAKEPVMAGSSAYAAEMAKAVGNLGSLYIAHIRYSSVGAHTLANTHPFSRELAGEDYVFEHNGNIPDFASNIPLSGFIPYGETDSEHVFCNLMASVSDGEISPSDPGFYPSLRNKFAGYNTFGIYNCLFMSYNTLFAYHDKDGFNGLHYLNREMDGTQGILISTRPLTGENWVPFAQGEMHVFKDGRIIF